MNTGIWLALGAYLLWGLFPIYWKLLKAIPSDQLVGHRVIWSFVFMLIILLVTRQFTGLRQALRKPKVIRTYLIASALIGTNWLVYVWGVNAGYIVETSLGYFINPLVSVILGVVILREKIRPWQWLPVGLAAVGVIYLTVSYGQLPWIALALAGTFAIYGLVKKTAPLGAVYGMSLETGFLFLPALGWLLYSGAGGNGAFAVSDLRGDLMLLGSGIVTAVPLLLFSSAAQKIPLSMIGILQYLAPTMQLLIGILIYGESFPQQKLIGYGLVWVALFIYWLEGWLTRRNNKKLTNNRSKGN